MPFSGCFTAIVTPFSGARVDEEALAAHSAWMVDHGVRGVVACGTTGESATLTEREKIRVIEVVAEAVGGRATVVAGTGSNDTAASAAFTREASRIAGVDAVMAVVPYYVKPSQAGIRAHFEAILDASEKPVVLYNVPGRTVVSMTAETMGQLAKDPRVVAIKEASGDMVLGSRTLDAVGTNAKILSGDDATTLPLMALGGSGSISVVSNVAPALMSTLCRAMLDGDLQTARDLQPEVLAWFDLLFANPNPVPTKILTSALGFGDAAPRLPHVGLEPAEVERVVERARALGMRR